MVFPLAGEVEVMGIENWKNVLVADNQDVACKTDHSHKGLRTEQTVP